MAAFVSEGRRGKWDRSDGGETGGRKEGKRSEEAQEEVEDGRPINGAIKEGRGKWQN